MTDDIRVLVIDPDKLFREEIAHAIANLSGFRVVGCFNSVTEAMEQLVNQPADLVLLESSESPGDAVTFLPRARAQGFTGPVVVVTPGLTLVEGAAFVHQGVSAICAKSQGVNPILEVMQLAVKGVTTIDERYFRAATGQKAAVVPDLTEREWQIVHHVINGLSNRQIAARIGMSEGTVKAALRRIYDATGRRSRSSLVCMLLDRTGVKRAP